MASISSLGLSGLPLTELLANLRTVEEAPLSLLENRKAGFETTISAYGILKNSLSSLQSPLQTLGESATYSAMTATSSNTSALTATLPANGGAVAGSYRIDVQSLAGTQSLVSAGQDSRSDALSTSDVTIKFTINGEEKAVTVAAADTSLEGIRKAINGTKDLGVSATLLNNGNGETGAHQLALSSIETGTAASISKIVVEGSSGDALQGLLGYDASLPVDEDNPTPGIMTQTVAAQDARLKVNGVQIVQGSNTITDAIEGVTLKLLATTTEDAPLNLRIAENTSVASTAVSTFVSAYNALQSAIKQLTSYNQETNQASALTGDRIPRTVQSSLQSVMASASGEGSIQVLSQMGITTNVTTGLLEIDTEKLDKALQESKGDVEAFFTGENGLATRLTNVIKGLTDSEGPLASATQGLERSIKNVNDQYERTSARIEDTMARYQAQFVQLEKVIAQMNSTSSYLTTQLEMLESTTKNAK